MFCYIVFYSIHATGDIIYTFVVFHIFNMEIFYCNKGKLPHYTHCNLWLQTSCVKLIIVSAYQYIAITNLPIIPVFVEYLGQFLIDFNQIYRHSSVPKNTSP